MNPFWNRLVSFVVLMLGQKEQKNRNNIVLTRNITSILTCYSFLIIIFWINAQIKFQVVVHIIKTLFRYLNFTKRFFS